MREVFLHGFFSGPSLWQPVLERLPPRPGAAGPQAVPLPFHGGEAAGSFAACCALMWQQGPLWAAARAGPIHLVGYSLGARMALTLACLKPQAIGQLTLIGVHPGLEDEAARQQRRQADARWQVQLREQPLHAFASAWDAQSLFAPRTALTEEAKRTLNCARKNLQGAALANSLEVLGLAAMPPLQAQLHNLRMPVQLMAGAHDVKFVALARQMIALLPQAALDVVAGAHHDVVLTHPEAVAARVLHVRDGGGLSSP